MFFSLWPRCCLSFGSGCVLKASSTHSETWGAIRIISSSRPPTHVVLFLCVLTAGSSLLPEEDLLGNRFDEHDWDKIANINVSRESSGHCLGLRLFPLGAPVKLFYVSFPTLLDSLVWRNTQCKRTEEVLAELWTPQHQQEGVEWRGNREAKRNCSWAQVSGLEWHSPRTRGKVRDRVLKPQAKGNAKTSIFF